MQRQVTVARKEVPPLATVTGVFTKHHETTQERVVRLLFDENRLALARLGPAVISTILDCIQETCAVRSHDTETGVCAISLMGPDAIPELTRYFEAHETKKRDGLLYIDPKNDLISKLIPEILVSIMIMYPNERKDYSGAAGLVLKNWHSIEEETKSGAAFAIGQCGGPDAVDGLRCLLWNKWYDFFNSPWSPEANSPGSCPMIILALGRIMERYPMHELRENAIKVLKLLLNEGPSSLEQSATESLARLYRATHEPEVKRDEPLEPKLLEAVLELCVAPGANETWIEEGKSNIAELKKQIDDLDNARPLSYKDRQKYYKLTKDLKTCLRNMRTFIDLVSRYPYLVSGQVHQMLADIHME